MTHRTVLSAAAAATLLAAAPALAAPITFGQTNADANSGTGDFGQSFVLNTAGDSDFTEAAYTLETATFFRGSGAGGSDTLFLDVYENTGADESAQFTGSGGAPAGVSYLGSSTNFVAYNSLVQGTALDFAFDGITLDSGTKYYLVFSSDGAAGNVVGTSTRQFGADTGFNYVNIDDIDTAPLFGGNEAGDTGATGSGANEHQFTVTVDSVPEPASLALLGLGGLGLVRRRR